MEKNLLGNYIKSSSRALWDVFFPPECVFRFSLGWLFRSQHDLSFAFRPTIGPTTKALAVPRKTFSLHTFFISISPFNKFPLGAPLFASSSHDYFFFSPSGSALSSCHPHTERGRNALSSIINILNLLCSPS